MGQICLVVWWPLVTTTTATGEALNVLLGLSSPHYIEYFRNLTRELKAKDGETILISKTACSHKVPKVHVWHGFRKWQIKGPSKYLQLEELARTILVRIFALRSRAKQTTFLFICQHTTMAKFLSGQMKRKLIIAGLKGLILGRTWKTFHSIICRSWKKRANEMIYNGCLIMNTVRMQRRR